MASDDDGKSWFNLDYLARMFNKINNVGAAIGNANRDNRRWQGSVGNVGGSSIGRSGNSPMMDAGGRLVDSIGDAANPYDDKGGIKNLVSGGENKMIDLPNLPTPINGACPPGYVYMPASIQDTGMFGNIDIPAMCIPDSSSDSSNSNPDPNPDPLDPDAKPDVPVDPAVGKYPELKTGQEIYGHILREKNTEGLTQEQVAKAQAYGKSLPNQAAIPSWLRRMLGLLFGGGMEGGNSRGATDLDEASRDASMQVYNDRTNFMKFAPSPLQQMDSRYYDSKSFVPEGEQKDFNMQLRSMPNQQYANYNTVKDREKPFFAEGGLSSLHPRMNGQISGPGTEKSDDIPAMLSDGEFVVNAAAVRGIGNLMGRKKPKSKVDQRREGARTMYALQKAGEQAARIG